MTEHGATSTDRAEPGGISVAIVDDQPHFYPRLIAEQLTAAGHHVVHRVERVEDLPPEPVDVVLCDVRLVRRGGSSGERAVALLVAAGHRVLLTSALAREEEVLDAIAAGAVGYLSKERLRPNTSRLWSRWPAAGSSSAASSRWCWSPTRAAVPSHGGTSPAPTGGFCEPWLVVTRRRTS
ncbi:MAG: response regulator [Kineosporiaceae bacterium]